MNYIKTDDLFRRVQEKIAAEKQVTIAMNEFYEKRNRIDGMVKNEFHLKTWQEDVEDFFYEQHRIFKLVYGRNQKSEKL